MKLTRKRHYKEQGGAKRKWRGTALQFELGKAGEGKGNRGRTRENFLYQK